MSSVLAQASLHPGLVGPRLVLGERFRVLDGVSILVAEECGATGDGFGPFVRRSLARRVHEPMVTGVGPIFHAADRYTLSALPVRAAS